jgi:O-antigen/teichoic acid export membrane protein
LTEPQRPYFRRVLIGALASSAGNAWTILLGVVTLPVLLGGLGRAGFGAWALLLLFNGTTGWLSILSVGTGVATTRLTAGAAARSAHDEVGASTRAALAAGALVGLVAFVLFATVGPGLFEALLGSAPDGLAAATRWFGLYLLAEQLALAVHASLDGMQQVGASRVADGLRRTLTLGAASITAAITGRLDHTVMALAVAAAIYSSVLLIATSSRLRVLSRGATSPGLRDLVQAAAPVVPLTSTGVAQRSMDRIIASVLFGPSAVALVEIATQVQNAAATILTSTSYVATTSAPWLEAQAATSQQRDLLLRGTRLTVFATYPACVALALLADPLLEVWLGDEGNGAARLVPLALGYIVVVAPLQVGSNVLLGLGRASAILRAALPALLANLVASVAFAELIGLEGVFLGTIVGSIVLAPLMLRRIGAATDVSATELAHSGILPVVVPLAALAATVAVIVALALSPVVTLGLGAGLGGIVYLGVAARWSPIAGDASEIRRALRGAAR